MGFVFKLSRRILVINKSHGGMSMMKIQQRFVDVLFNGYDDAKNKWLVDFRNEDNFLLVPLSAPAATPNTVGACGLRMV